MKNKQSRGIRIRLSLTEIFYNGCFASANFLSVFLQSLGIGAGQIGIVTSLTNVMNIVSQPVWGVLSDRIRSVRKCFMLSIILSALCVLFVPMLSVAGAMVPMMALLVLQYFFLTPANMLMELWLVKVNNTPGLGISYGSIRIWASLGFALMNLAYVPMVNAAYAGVNIIAAMFGGFILEGIGTRSFFAMITLIQVSAAVFLVLSQVFGVKVLGKVLPMENRIWRVKK